MPSLFFWWHAICKEKRSRERFKVHKGVNDTQILPIKMSTTFAKGNVNAFLLPEAPVTLVDAGTHLPDSIQQLREGMAEVGYTFQDVEQIVVTHMHTDHFGGVSDILQETDAVVYVHKQAMGIVEHGREVFEHDEAFMRSFIEECGAADLLKRERKYHPLHWREVHYLDEGDVLFAGGREWKVIYTPGHSQSDICLWDQKTGDAIVGDFLLQEISSNAFIAPPDRSKKLRPRPLMQMRDSFQHVYDLPLGTIYPGHGDPFSNFRALIDQRFQEQEERCDKIVSLLAEGPRTVSDMTRRLFPWLQENGMFLGLSEVQGHLDLLLERRRVRVEHRGPIAWYQSEYQGQRGEA